MAYSRESVEQFVRSLLELQDQIPEAIRRTRVAKEINIIKCSPVGWWFNEGRIADQWSGPFETPEEAQRTAEMMAPDRVEFIKLMQVMPWEKREVKVENKRYKKCDCKSGFRGDRVCRKCEGTGRIEV